jgi:mannitol/fructose-specific phosphotransferase system IIA component (Ntr-type)
MPSLRSVLDAGCVAVDVAVADKKAALGVLVAMIAASGKADDSAGLLRAVLDREALAPTGIGSDCAIPHAQTDAVAETRMAAIRLAQPIGFGAPDGTAARLVFLIVGPKDSAALHLRLLSRLARVLSDDDIRSRLLAVADATAFMDVLFSIDPPPSACA